jgi:hypothetical protein
MRPTGRLGQRSCIDGYGTTMSGGMRVRTTGRPAVAVSMARTEHSLRRHG